MVLINSHINTARVQSGDKKIVRLVSAYNGGFFILSDHLVKKGAPRYDGFIGLTSGTY